MNMDNLKNQLRDLIEKNDEESNSEILKLLEPFKDRLYDLRYRDGETLLHWASAFNNAYMTEFFIKNGIHVNFENYRGTTPLYYACMNNAKDSIRALIKYRANPYMRSGFSGDLPVTILTDDDLITEIAEHAINDFPMIDVNDDDTLVIKTDNKLLTYKYRLYMNIRSTAFYLSNPNKRNLTGWDIEVKYEEIFDNEGLVGLMKVCQSAYDNYFDELNDSKKEGYSTQRCLYCNKKDSLRQCSKCKTTYFCNSDCQKKTYLIHKFDCKI